MIGPEGGPLSADEIALAEQNGFLPRRPRPPSSAHRNSAGGGRGTVPVVVGRYRRLTANGLL